MILYDKTALTEKFGRKVTGYIETLLTPEAGENEIKNALERLMSVDTGKLVKKFGDEPPEICIAAAVGFLRLEGGNDSDAGAVAADNFNEAVRLSPELGNDSLFRNDFIYDLIKTGAEQGDNALSAILCDLYTGDVTAPGANSHFESDGMTRERLDEAIEALLKAETEDDDQKDAIAVTGVSPAQLKEELEWLPYEENGYACSRRFANEAKTALGGGNREEAAELFFKSALMGSFEAAATYVSLTTGIFDRSDFDRKTQLKTAKICRKATKKAEKLKSAEVPAAEMASVFDREELAEFPAALYRKSIVMKDGSPEESLRLLEAAADKGDHEAELDAAEYYGSDEHFDFEKMMRFLFEGLANPGSFAAYGPKGLPLGDIAAYENTEAYELMTRILGRLCPNRDLVDELEELTEPKESGLPELTPEQQKSVFMWFLCDPGSDEKREILARMYDMGFGTAKDGEKASSIRKELCEKYASEDVTGDGGDGTHGADNTYGNGIDDDEKVFMPYESFYSYALELITAEGEKRDIEGGRALLTKIPEESPIHQKAAKLLALTETETSELIRLGNMFHKEGNDGAMLKLYEAAEKFGDPVAARLLGRYYSLEENGADDDKALSHFEIGASRGDVQSMYFAGSTCQTLVRPHKALEYFEQCASAGEQSGDKDDRTVAARAMKEAADLYYSGAITGEKDVPHYLYWLDRAERAGYRLSDTVVDRRRAAENYFKPAQWQELYAGSLSLPEDGYREWIIRTCADKKITAAQEEFGVRLYRGEWKKPVTDQNGKPVSAYSLLKTPALSSPRAQYYAACSLYLGKGCEKNINLALETLPPEDEFGDPENLRREITGMAAYLKAGELGERHADEAAELLKKAEEDLTVTLRECGNGSVIYELADILIRAYDIPDSYESGELNAIWKKGYSYLIEGYNSEPRCKEQIDAYTPGRICEIAGMFEGDEALAWYNLAADRDAKAQFGAGSVLLERGRNADNGKVTDADSLDKAREMIRRAADLECAEAELAMYKERKYMDIDGDNARLYLKRAAVHGSEEARTLCREAGITY